MYTLFIDTHAANILLILYKDNNLYKIKNKESNSQSEVIMPTLIELLEEENLTVDNLSKIAVVIGPGSFTGVRLGVTIAKTIGYCKNIPIVTVTSLELGLPTKAPFISELEKNGYYIGSVTNDSIQNYQYLKKDEYLEFIKTHEVDTVKDINYDYLIKVIHQKESVNPHKVNPFYVKLIEVEQK